MFVRHLPDHPLAEALDGYFFQYRRAPDGVTAIAQHGSDLAAAPIVWIFGAGRQGQTPVLHYQGHFIEHRVSLYTATGYGITIGQNNGVSASATAALGWTESDAEARTCFNCHATSASDDLTRLTPGVQCVRCHAGAEEHANGHGKPVNPGNLDHLAQVQLCGTCHRLKPPSGDESDIANVRFQPLRLMQSACFLKSNIAHAPRVIRPTPTRNATRPTRTIMSASYVTQIKPDISAVKRVRTASGAICRESIRPLRLLLRITIFA